MKFTRITVNANQMGGVPCIRGLRIPVATVVGMAANRMMEHEILAAFPDLEPEESTKRCCLLHKPYANANCQCWR